MSGLFDSSRYWPTIDSQTKAVDAMHLAAYVAALSALVTAAISIQALYVGQPVLGMRGSALIDATLVAIIAWRIYRLSLPWSIAGLVIYTFERLFTLTHHLSLGTIAFTIVFFPYYLTAVRGALFLRDARTPATVPVEKAEATLEDHEAFRQYMAQSYRPFHKSDRSVQEEFNFWLADRRQKKVGASFTESGCLSESSVPSKNPFSALK